VSEHLSRDPKIYAYTTIPLWGKGKVIGLILVDNLFKAGVGNFTSLLIKARRTEYDIERLPLAGGFRNIDPRRMSLVALRGSVVIPSLIDTTAFVTRVFRLFLLSL
jgi:hypothetical protein